MLSSVLHSHFSIRGLVPEEGERLAERAVIYRPLGLMTLPTQFSPISFGPAFGLCGFRQQSLSS